MSDSTSNKSANEKRNQYLILGALALLLIYTFAELWSFYSGNRKRLSKQQDLVALLYGPDTAAISRSKRPTVPTNNLPLATSITTSGNRYDIDIARIEPVSEQQMKIWFENAPYEKLAQWITRLEFAEGVRAVSLNLERGDALGSVSGQIEVSKES